MGIGFAPLASALAIIVGIGIPDGALIRREN